MAVYCGRSVALSPSYLCKENDVLAGIYCYEEIVPVSIG